jgi:hypothetical protein
MTRTRRNIFYTKMTAFSEVLAKRQLFDLQTPRDVPFKLKLNPHAVQRLAFIPSQ